MNFHISVSNGQWSGDLGRFCPRVTAVLALDVGVGPASSSPGGGLPGTWTGAEALDAAATGQS